MIDWYKDILKVGLKKKERDESEDTDSEVETLEEIDSGEHGYGDIYPKK